MLAITVDPLSQYLNKTDKKKYDIKCLCQIKWDNRMYKGVVLSETGSDSPEMLVFQLNDFDNNFEIIKNVEVFEVK